MATSTNEIGYDIARAGSNKSDGLPVIKQQCQSTLCMLGTTI